MVGEYSIVVFFSFSNFCFLDQIFLAESRWSFSKCFFVVSGRIAFIDVGGHLW